MLFLGLLKTGRKLTSQPKRAKVREKKDTTSGIFVKSSGDNLQQYLGQKSPPKSLENAKNNFSNSYVLASL